MEGGIHINSTPQLPPSPLQQKAGSEQTSHRTSSNFILSFIFGVRALRAPLHHFSYESWKNVSCRYTAQVLQGQVRTSAPKANVLPRLPAGRASEAPAGQRCARGRPAALGEEAVTGTGEEDSSHTAPSTLPLTLVRRAGKPCCTPALP